MKKQIEIFLVAMMAAMYAVAAPIVTDVVAKQRYPWNGLVDITCKVSGIDGTTNGLKFAVASVAPNSGNVCCVFNFWVVQNGTNTVDYEVHTNGDYRLIWDAQADLGQVIYSNMVVHVSVDHGKVQLWEDGPYWATTNIGADEPWNYGYYFWWGDTIGYRHEDNAWVASDGSLPSFSFGHHWLPTYGKDVATLQDEGWITEGGALVPEHDAAQVQWGRGWRMPTFQELCDLGSNCDLNWTTMNGVNGYVVHGRGVYASKSIFLPCAGKGMGASLCYDGSSGSYWLSVPYSDGPYSRYLNFDSEHFASGNNSFSYGDRDAGFSVRPIQGFAEAGETSEYSVPFLLDTETISTSPVVDSISISWDAAWIGGDTNATVVISDNGTRVKCLTGSGDFQYALTSVGRHELTYTTYIGGVVQDEAYTITVYAHSYIVDFVANGGIVEESNRNVISACVVGGLPMATREGYTFDGWFTAASGGSEVKEEAIITADVTFYA